ncbi:MAG: TonB family protein [Alphaproteobacteria bacterium]|nr:TonB family protein [Alphaproteobacteria bacterium]
MTAIFGRGRVPLIRHLRRALRLLAIQLAATGILGPLSICSAEDVPLHPTGGVYALPVRINDTITMDFLVDSGASVVTIPADVASTLMRTGALSQQDLQGEQQYRLADGSAHRSPVVMIHKLQIGNFVISNVAAAIAPPDGALLLGQSFLARLHRWSIDNSKHAFTIEGPIADAVPLALAPPPGALQPPSTDAGGAEQQGHVAHRQVDGPIVDANGNAPARAIGDTHDCTEFYPSESRATGESGDVLVGYDIAANGVIMNVRVVRTSGSDRLDQAAVVCVGTRWRNWPAMQGGKPVASPGHQAIVRFSLH